MIRLIRVVLLVIAACAVAAVVFVLLTGPAGVDLGTWWHGRAPESLNLTQAVTQRYLHPALWTHVMLPLLLMRAAGVFITTAVIAVLLFIAVSLVRRRTK